MNCKTCEDKGFVEGDIACGTSRGQCHDGMCGGCYSSERCPDCDAADDHEPDWDAIAEARREDREMRQ